MIKTSFWPMKPRTQPDKNEPLFTKKDSSPPGSSMLEKIRQGPWT
jgi:hypothetical protein